MNPPPARSSTRTTGHTLPQAKTRSQGRLPPYMDQQRETARILAMRMLAAPALTLDTLRDAASNLATRLRRPDSRAGRCLGRRAAGGRTRGASRAADGDLRAWDYRWSASSVPTTLAVYWGEALWLAHGTDPDSEDAADTSRHRRHHAAAEARGARGCVRPAHR